LCDGRKKTRQQEAITRFLLGSRLPQIEVMTDDLLLNDRVDKAEAVWI
jgi:hypothetical protein